MESTIRKKVKGKIMEAVFDSSELVNVKFFRVVNLLDEESYDEEKTYLYSISIRHGENEDPQKLFDKAVTKIKKSLRDVQKTLSKYEKVITL